MVNFSSNSYTFAEMDGHVSLSLCIGQFFAPVWAIIEISDGTATGGLYNIQSENNDSPVRHLKPSLQKCKYSNHYLPSYARLVVSVHYTYIPRHRLVSMSFYVYN